MKLATLGCRIACALVVVSSVQAQAWRRNASGIGSTARVLIIGARPEDEDNALIAWLSLGRNVETAYLSLTRGESGQNVAGNERQSALAVVRTAELLAERECDGAHQYFTRAYDFGSTRSDSVVDVAWPHDSLLEDVVSVVRAFRPQGIISMVADSDDHDATRRIVARLAREAFSAAADSVRFPPAKASLLPAWATSRLFTYVDSSHAHAISIVPIDVGEFDRATGRSYAELGAEIRRLQRTQPTRPAVPIGPVWRYVHLDSSRGGDGVAGLFGSADTAWMRFRVALGAAGRPQLDSLEVALTEARALAQNGAANEVAAALARVVQQIASVRAPVACRENVVPVCSGILGDLAVSLNATRERAKRALIGAAGVVIEGTVGRELVAAGDSVPVTVTVYNGGVSPLIIRRLAVSSRLTGAVLLRDSTVVHADSVARWSSTVRVLAADLHWWQVHGILPGTWIHDIALSNRRAIPQLISGEDRIVTSGVDATVVVGGFDVPIVEAPLVYRGDGAVRGDLRHPLAGVLRLSVLLERGAEYERAGLPIDRLFRVFVSTPRAIPDTVTVSLQFPPGLKADSARRTVILPAFGARNVFFRLRGILRPASDSIAAEASLPDAAAPIRLSSSDPARSAMVISVGDDTYNYGTIWHDYPHIPSQPFIRRSNERLEAVDVRVPRALRVAYIKGTDDVQSPLGQLQVNVQTLEPSLLSVVDLSAFTTVLIGADALANDALAGAVPSLHEFVRNGGTVVILPGQGEVGRSGLLPYPIQFDTLPIAVDDPAAPVHVTAAGSRLLTWPNAIRPGDFDDWVGERARDVPAVFDQRYRTVMSTGDAGQTPTTATVLIAPVGRGMVVYTSLSLDRQLAAANPGAARIFVNMLSAGLAPRDVRRGTR